MLGETAERRVPNRGSQPIRDAMEHNYRDLNNFRVIDTLTVNT